MSRFSSGLISFRLALVLLGAGLVASLLPSGSFAAHRAQKALPRLVIDSTKKDFGEVYAGEELEHVFTVRNEGDGPLELSETPLVMSQSGGPRGNLIRAVSFESSSARSGKFGVISYAPALPVAPT